MKLNILNQHGNFTDKEIDFKDIILSTKSYNHCIYLEIKRYLSAQRQGTHSAKNRSKIIGSNRKLHKQKGLGGSRKGSIKNPLFRGGGRIFGPIPKKYNIKKTNKITKHLVRQSILKYKLTTNTVFIVEDIKLTNPSTKTLVKILVSMKLNNNKKSLMIINNINNNLYLSSRNLQNFKLLLINNLNSYLLLKYYYIIFTESALINVFNFFKKK
ncbi:50S ribosomal protein L4 [Blattabacterium cuenoti]|uniref:50S ribosomal protein L4 n=1 Tax=Blattabacterium cuenoti TaxID=1653831 RepID=UPI00163B773D|nr:50S ribosomal protein L4 [Blattabacterium cuenoti]